jgi:hemoglobin
MRTKKIDHLSEDAIHHLVDEFYARIRVDPDLGQVFARAIPGD